MAGSVRTEHEQFGEQQMGPILARERGYGPREYDRFDHLSSSPASIGSGSIEGRHGKVEVDVKFLFKKSRWGVLGENRNPAGIVYMDLSFNEPIECKLRTAIVRVKLDDQHKALRTLPDEVANANDSDRDMPGQRQLRKTTCPAVITDWFGPKRLSGEERQRFLRRTKQFTPEFYAMGQGAGGVGINKEKMTQQRCRWTFSGQIVNDDAMSQDEKGYRRQRSQSTAPEERGPSWMYKTLVWRLTENDLEEEIQTRTKSFHTAFAFEHGGQPFFMTVEVEGRVEKKKRHFSPRLSKFGKKLGGKDNRVVTLVNFKQRDGVTWWDKSLDEHAKGLSEAMVVENYLDVAPEIPTAMPMDLQSSPSLGSDAWGYLQGGVRPSLPSIGTAHSLGSASQFGSEIGPGRLPGTMYPGLLEPPPPSSGRRRSSSRAPSSISASASSIFSDCHTSTGATAATLEDLARLQSMDFEPPPGPPPGWKKGEKDTKDEARDKDEEVVETEAQAVATMVRTNFTLVLWILLRISSLGLRWIGGAVAVLGQWLSTVDGVSDGVNNNHIEGGRNGGKNVLAAVSVSSSSATTGSAMMCRGSTCPPTRLASGAVEGDDRGTQIKYNLSEPQRGYGSRVGQSQYSMIHECREVNHAGEHAVSLSLEARAAAEEYWVRLHS
ncbi:hypothetical protein MKZ38_004455 [Zalerion maritima]|uniref:Uncharacterized protein n=1 Tax=Zalerion maritima TaxID=339359 RepID=A0AAD5WXF1_9PEZI|nr:hypothetical protein MKZ38_004455 [Zalerion maritima]